MNNERGFATALAFGVMAIVIAMVAFSPIGNNVLLFATKQQQNSQAIYAAEVGMRASTLILNNSIIANSGQATTVQYAIPSGLLATSPLTPYYIGAVNADGSVDNNVYYTVSVSVSPSTIPAASSTPQTLIYTLTVVGHSDGGATKTLVGQYSATIAATTSGPTASGPTTIWQPPTNSNYQNTIKYTVLGSGDLVAYSGNSATNSTNGAPYSLGTTASSISFPWGLSVTTGVNNVYLTLLNSSFFSLSNPQLASYTQTTQIPPSDTNTQYGSSWSNLWNSTPIIFQTGTLYYVNGNVTINTSTPIYTSDYASSGKGKVIIYSTGNITLNEPLLGNFVFIANGSITTDSGVYYQGQLELYANNGITLNQLTSKNVSTSLKSYGIFMTTGTLTVNGGNLGEAFMFGGTSVLLEGGGIINGAVYSNGPITISGANITYDATAIPQ